MRKYQKKLIIVYTVKYYIIKKISQIIGLSQLTKHFTKGHGNAYFKNSANYIFQQHLAIKCIGVYHYRNVQVVETRLSTEIKKYKEKSSIEKFVKLKKK